MEETVRDKVQRALAPLVNEGRGRLVLDDDVPPGKVAGTLISEAFVGKSSAERQDLIWDALDHALSKYERTRVVIILANTPDEYELYKDTA